MKGTHAHSEIQAVPKYVFFLPVDTFLLNFNNFLQNIPKKFLRKHVYTHTHVHTYCIYTERLFFSCTVYQYIYLFALFSY